MKTRNKIALTFTVITSVSLAASFLVIYVLSSRYTHREFFRRLHERADIAAQAFFKEDELEQRVFEKIRQEHLHILPEEKEYFISLELNDGQSHPDSVPAWVDLELLQKIKNKHYVEFYTETGMGVSLDYLDNEGRFAVILTAEDHFGESKLRHLSTVMFGILGGYLILVFFIGKVYARHILSPINRMADHMNEINTSSLHLRLEEEKGNKEDELVRVAQTFNQMLDRLETSIEAQGSFIANASHQLKNPLAAILAEIETILKTPRPLPEYQQALELIGEEANRLEALILRLLRLAQTESREEQSINQLCRVDDLLYDLQEEYRAIFPENRLLIDYSGFPEDPNALVVSANYNLLKIAVSNIIDNAFKFSEEKEVVVSLNVSVDRLTVHIQDQGLGIPSEDVKHIFDTFYRANNVLHIPGFGIGLPMVQKIMHLHDGQIQVQSQLSIGTVFSLTFPRKDAGERRMKGRSQF